MPRKRKEKVTFDIPDDVQSASQAGWVQRVAAAPEAEDETPQLHPESHPLISASPDAASLPTAAVLPERAAGDTLLPARQYIWSAPAPGRMAVLKARIERGIALCAIPFEIGLTLALGLCTRPQDGSSRAAGVTSPLSDEKEER